MIQKKTLIYLHKTAPLTASWVVFNENGQLEQSVFNSHLDQLLPNAKNNDITVIVPAEDIVLTHAILPKMPRQRLMQALPFALEEQLIDDVAELHFAIAEYQTDGSTPVAIVAKNKMHEWLALLQQFDLNPSQLISAVFALPFSEKNWAARVSADMCTVHHSEYNGFACEKENLSTLLELTYAETEQKPDCVHVYEISPVEQNPVNAEKIPVLFNEMQLSEQSFLEKAALWIESGKSINLLQGTFQAKRKASETKKIWLIAAYATLAWIGLAFFSNVVSFIILHSQSSALENAINSIYKRNFPEASAIVAPRERMESKLKTVTAQANKNYFLAVLANVGNVLAKNTSVQLHNMDFRDNQLSLDIAAATFDNLDAFTKALAQQGLTVKQQNAAIAGTQVKATLLVQRGLS